MVDTSLSMEESQRNREQKLTYYQLCQVEGKEGADDLIETGKVKEVKDAYSHLKLAYSQCLSTWGQPTRVDIG